EERRLYDLILNNTRRQINSLVSKRDIRSCSKFFTAMLRMRMLCNLGTYSSNGSRTISVGRHDLEIGCELCSATDDDATTLLDGYSVCPQCGRPLQQSSPLPEFIDDPRSDADNSGRNAGMALDKAAYALVAQMNPFLRGGISTKLNAVVQNVVCCGPDAKSIIFSYWTSTLDLLSQLLRKAHITYRQVDGRTSYAERSKSLEAFRKDPKILVLLMSIEIGAVGLNLTVANKVHLVEPQWNPAVEEQAVVRALRMGQDRDVADIGAVTNIINLQKKKKLLAKFTFGAGTETLSDTLEDLRSVFNMVS
ncbi:P-loop containing nucleoside triphosphate hydrolase protein, partial [Nemania serpens]